MDAVSEIKRRIDPVEYIGRSVQLRKSGKNYRGLCPFHNEKTPSFYVFTDSGIWRCFGSCGEGGDVLAYVQKRENLDFREALRTLAAEAGVELSARAAEQRTRAEQLSSIVSAAVDFYERQLASDEGAAARDYLTATRGLNAETIAHFHLGWAPDEWRPLRDYLLGRGYSDEDALAAGVLAVSDEGGTPYDRFRGRVIIPITDERGTYIGLGGRILGAGEPKYLNSPQTEIFDKGRILYALDGAGTPARESGAIVVVEGYLDVIGPWQGGFRNLVATMGTSLTAYHATRITRFVSRVVLAMDPDSAGMAAAERAGALFLGLDSPEAMGAAQRSVEAISSDIDLDLRVAPLPAGQDPDDLAREDPDAWRAAIEQATPFTQFLLERLIAGRPDDTPLEAGRIVERLRPVLLAVRNPVERAANVQRVARRLGVAERAISERLRVEQRRAPAQPAAEVTPVRAPVEEALLSTLLRHPELRTDLRHLPADLFSDARDREIVQRWHHDQIEAVADADAETHPDSDPDDDPTDDPIAARLQHLFTRREPALAHVDARRRASDLIRHILRERLIQRHSAVTEELAEAERTLGTSRVQEVSHLAWLGALPSDETFELAQTAIEELELGLSIHSRERDAS